MLTFLPVILLFITALAVYLLRFLPRGMGYAWLTAVFMSLLIWGGVFAYHWLSQPGVTIPPWRPFDPNTADAIRFGWDQTSWNFGFALVSVNTAVLLTSGARLQFASRPVTWAANLSVAGAGLIAVLAQTPLALALGWMPLDLLDFLIILRLTRPRQPLSFVVTAFTIRSASTFMLLSALIIQRAIGMPLEFGSMSPVASLLVMLAFGIRLGLLPLNLLYSQESTFQRGLISNLRLAAYAAGLAGLTRITQLNLPDGWWQFLYIISILAVFYGALMWFSAQDEIAGRPYWLLSFSGIVFACVLQGSPANGTAWGIVMLISGALLFLFSTRSRGLLFLPALGLISLTGLPYTVASSGWPGLIQPPFGPGDLFFLISVAFLLAGYGRHALKADDNLATLEVWARGFYPIGLSLLVASGWMTGALGLTTGLNSGQWLQPLVAALIAGLIGGVSWQQEKNDILSLSPRLVETLQKVWRWLENFFKLGWFYRLLRAFHHLLRQFVGFLTLLFEGEGGLLWSFLLLTLLLTILASRAG